MNCAHRQAEPVILSTGEQVACVCIACIGVLSSGWVQGQYDRALREAYCTHEDEFDISSFGQLPGSTMTCVSCGRLRKS